MKAKPTFEEFMKSWSNMAYRRRIVAFYQFAIERSLNLGNGSNQTMSVPENPDPKLIYNYFYGNPLQLNADEDQSLFWDDVASRPYATIPICKEGEYGLLCIRQRYSRR